MQIVNINWKGQAFRFKPEFELFEEIEQKVSINRVFHLMNQSGVGNAVDVPMSHVAWMLFCCLRRAGAQVASPLAVQHAIVAEEFNAGEVGVVIGQLMIAFWGPQSQRQPKKKTTGKKLTRKSPTQSEST